ncbi:hypothetical protein HDU97_003809 [Phlyctochytrium planicorne]|nr:hypothetical protein HDU97_003809 [Phlyctochytrium planicorne]
MDFKTFKVMVKEATLVAIPIFCLNVVIAVIPQAAVAYPDSVWAAIIISLSSYILRFYFFSSFVKFEGTDAKEKINYFYPFLILSEIVDLGLPRYFALHMILVKATQAKKISNEDSDKSSDRVNEAVAVLEDKYFDAKSPPPLYSHDLNVVAPSNVFPEQYTGPTIAVITEVAPDIDDNSTHLLPPPSQTNLLLESPDKSEAMTTILSANIPNIPKTLGTNFEKLLGANESTFRNAPYEYLRRDLCFADHVSNLLSLSLFLLFPRDFLPPETLENTDGSWIQDMISLYNGPWFAPLWLAWFISFALSIPCEYMIAWLEQIKARKSLKIHAPFPACVPCEYKDTEAKMPGLGSCTWAFISCQLKIYAFVTCLVPLLVMFYWVLRCVLLNLHKPPFGIDTAIAAAVVGMMCLQLRAILAYTIHKFGIKSFLMDVPTALVQLVSTTTISVVSYRLAPRWARLIFCVGYVFTGFLGGFTWRLTYFGCGPRTDGRLKQYMKFLKDALELSVSLVGMNFTYALVIEVARAYPDSWVAGVLLSLGCYILKIFILIGLAKIESTIILTKQKTDLAKNGNNLVFLIALTTPLRLIRLMKATRMPPALYWPFLIISQIWDMGFPRYVALSMTLKGYRAQIKKTDIERSRILKSQMKIAVVDKVDEVVEPGETCEIKIEKPSSNLDSKNVAANGNSIEKVSSIPRLPKLRQGSNKNGSQVDQLQGIGDSKISANSSSDTVDTSKTTDGLLSPIPLGEEVSKLANSAAQLLTSSNLDKNAVPAKPTGGLETNLNALMEYNANITFRNGPYEFLRRDLCFVEHICNLLSFSLIIFCPRDFLYPGTLEAWSESEPWYQDVIALYFSPWFTTIVMAWLVSFLISMPLEYLIILWEEHKGFGLYPFEFKIVSTRFVVIVISLLYQLCWLMAGAHGLLNYGDLYVN